MTFAVRTLRSSGGLDAYLASSYDVEAFEFYPGAAYAGIRLTSAGAVETEETEAVWGNVDTWLTEGANTDFQCRWTTTSGTLTSGTNGSWEALSSTRTWEKVRSTGVGSSTVVGTLEIRRTSDSVVVASATVSLQATLSA